MKTANQEAEHIEPAILQKKWQKSSVHAAPTQRHVQSISGVFQASAFQTLPHSGIAMQGSTIVFELSAQNARSMLERGTRLKPDISLEE